MKSYKITSFDKVQYFVIILIYTFVGVFLTGVIGYYSQNIALTSFFGIFLVVFAMLFYKRIIVTKKISVTIDSEGVTLSEMTKKILWGDIIWYKNDKANLVDQISIRYKEGKQHIVFYAKSEDHSEWESFKKDFYEKIDENCLNIGNYYDASIWTYVIYATVASYILLPLSLTFFEIDLKKIIPSFLIYLGTTMTLTSVILVNRKRKKKP